MKSFSFSRDFGRAVSIKKLILPSFLFCLSVIGAVMISSRSATDGYIFELSYISSDGGLLEVLRSSFLAMRCALLVIAFSFCSFAYTANSAVLCFYGFSFSYCLYYFLSCGNPIFSFAFFDLIFSFVCIFPLMFYITFIPIAQERTGERDIRKILFYAAVSFLCVFCVKAVLYLLHILF